MNDILIAPIGLLPNFVAFKRAICPITTTLFFDTLYIYYVGSRDEDTTHGKCTIYSKLKTI